MNLREQRRHEVETIAYKHFMKVAKRVSNLQYGKWKIVPDVNDPLRKFVLEREIGWACVKYCLVMEEYYHRGDYSENRTDYRAKLAVYGLFAHIDKQNGRVNPLYANMGMRLKPRMAKKLILATDEVIIPKFYQAIETEDKLVTQQHLQTQAFKNELAKIPTMKVEQKNNYYNSSEYQGTIKNCPFVINLKSSTVELEGSLSYDDFAVIVNRMGWGK